jgi:hypothetical protein
VRPAGRVAELGSLGHMNALRSPLAAALALIVAVVAVIAWLVAGDPISQAKWDRVREGMSREQVLKVMGEPDSYDGHDQIEYSRFMNVGWIEFHFDERDVLIEKNDESVFGSLR